MTFVPHHCWKTAMNSPSSNTLRYLGERREGDSQPLVCPTPAPRVLKNTGLSGIQKLSSRKTAAGSVSAQNIQRHPHAMFHAWAAGTVVSRASSIFTICAARMPSTIVI